jgi:heme-degrading monooxygenase HmoA
VTPRSKSDEYLAYLKETDVKDYALTPGNKGAMILVRQMGKETEFIIISVWDSMDAIKKFAGEDVEKARYYPKDREFLQELEPFVKHYDVAFES